MLITGFRVVKVQCTPPHTNPAFVHRDPFDAHYGATGNELAGFIKAHAKASLTDWLSFARSMECGPRHLSEQELLNSVDRLLAGLASNMRSRGLRTRGEQEANDAGRPLRVLRCTPKRVSHKDSRAAGNNIDFNEESVVDRLKHMTQGKGTEKCIDAVGMESHATRSFDALYDGAKQAVMLETDRARVLREMIYVCRPAGTLSMPGVYGGLIDKIPFGAAMNKGPTWRMGQTHVNGWTDNHRAFRKARSIRPSSSRTASRSRTAPGMYKTFRDKEDGCIKVVLKP